MNLNKRELTFEEIISMQMELNDLYNPTWKEDRKPVDFALQVLDESAEFLGSGVDYKWWTKPKTSFDKWNTKIEMTDILFFASSLAYFCENEDTGINIFEDGGLLEGDKINSHAMVLLNFAISANALGVRNCLSVGDICQSILKSGVFDSMEELSACYVAKYQLNKFRISQDYQSGKYQKVKDGVEDNTRMHEIVSAFMTDQSKTLQFVSDSVDNEFFRLKESA